MTNTIFAQGYLHANGKKIVNGNNEEILLKGIGLGGWLVQEGYMLKTPYSIAGAEHQIRNEIQKLVGVEKTNELYSIYHKNYVREIDVENIAKWGFNSIRLPMHWNKLISETNPLTFSKEGFQTIDSLLNWCEKNQIYLILDLHAAPGGQSDEAISDYDNSKPSLWESEDNKNLTIELWKEIAKRYFDKEWIGGYDLINEPKWELGSENKPLRDLYLKITDSIRTVDTNHILFIEGNWYATDFNGLTPPWDDNMSYSFHRYWNSNDQGTIQYLVNLRDQNNVPLWLGETGENSNSWFLDCIDLMKKNNIGWAWWPHKKIDNVVGPLSAPMVSGYQTLLDYWNGTGNKPSELYAYAVLLSQFENLKFENCTFQPDVVDALIRHIDDKTSRPFKELTIPGRIFATDYDLGPRLISYNDVDYDNTKGLGNAEWNTGGKYRNDGVDIEICTDQITNGFNVGWIETGEWLKFTVSVIEDGNYTLSIRSSANSSGGKILFAIDGAYLTEFIDVPVTNGWQNWKTTIIDDYFLSQGQHEIFLKFYFNGYNFNYFEFTQSTVGLNDEENLREYFQLFQNYPNPFNPNTTIKYSIPNIASNINSNTELRIYDILGREVKTLVDQFQPAGNYEINFNASEFPSGVYYYELKNGSINQTKKMILLN
ncbi:MAG: cellulase family glycosylhydrolase [Ignavibacteriae bacterium]|nr:cellulase family glycosylhydrolase [Ignavibacteriota bacterium]